jgi:hypothetical protein
MPRQLRNARLAHLLIEAHLQWGQTWRNLSEQLGKSDTAEYFRHQIEYPNHADLVVDDSLLGFKGVG